MSTRRLVKSFQKLFKLIGKLSRAITKALMKWLLRSLLVLGRRRSLARAGFVLPTVTMVTLVVVLLTTAILIRSFDRAKNASNFRVNRAVLAAATPAIDRAKAKIEAVFKDPTLPRSTPSDTALYSAFRNNTYTFGDETRLKLAYDFGNANGDPNPDGQINTNVQEIEKDETLNTAWRFPVDTDNNGLYDSYTLYSINFRSPTRDRNNRFNRDRSPLDARTPPMDQGQVGGRCAAAIGNSASLVGDTDWYKSGGNLKKSFFVFVATVPITGDPPPPDNQGIEFESYRGNQGFSGLEYQMDKSIVPLSNNAVWFEDDIEINNIGGGFRLNGRVFTNSNLLVQGTFGNSVDFYQVSSPDSCYYDQENAKILVAGNVADDGIEPTDANPAGVSVHLFNGADANPVVRNFGNGLETTNENGGTLVAYNTQAYAQRIGAMVDAASEFAPEILDNPNAIAGVNQYPEQVKERFEGRFRQENAEEILEEELENYFRERTRRVPYAEVDFGEDALGGVAPDNPFGATNPVRPPDDWMLIDNTGLGLEYLDATEPTLQQARGIEEYVGDRILVGNNLPDRWYKGGGEFAEEGEEQPIDGQNWTEPNGEQRERISQIETQPDLGNIERNGFWEQEAAKLPGQNENTGGLRVITGAGIYGYPGSIIPALDTTATVNPSFLPELNDLNAPGYFAQASGAFDPTFVAAPNTFVGTPEANVLDVNVNTLLSNPTIAIPESQVLSAPFRLVWPDTMPMSIPDNSTTPIADIPGNIQIEGDESTQLPDLRMRATAVYHYAVDAVGPNDTDPDQLPIACVSSYLDPTNNQTARNPATDLNGNPLPDVSGGIDNTGDGIIDILADGSTPAPQLLTFADGAKSNNGVSYPSPYGGARNYTAYDTELRQQASMMFPNGRLANKPLYDAFIKIDNGTALTLADYSAIDSTVCAIQILDGTLAPNDAVIPHGAIKEAAFLDGRQVKSLKAVPDDYAGIITTPTPTLNLDENITHIASLSRDLIDTTIGTRAALATDYDLQLEQRQPLEIRVTEIDLNLLRQTKIGTPTNSGNNDPNNDQEFLIPNSGIIYASRDDALPDLSAIDDPDTPENESLFPDLVNLTTEAKLVSREDFKLDPTRRPNGIRLINGANLARETFDRIAEKGLILVSNLPVYVKGDFNQHDYEEFTQELTPGAWANFYDRQDLDDRFACRPGRPGCNPNQGDNWRSATIVSDAVTLLSGGPDKDGNYKEGFKDGFRVDGDYDLRNNAGNSLAQARLKQGFWFNNFVTSADWDGTTNIDGFPDDEKRTSYVTNGVTPIQRRAEFPEYLMEVCPKVPVSTCGPNDWYLDPGDPLNTDAGGLPAPIPQVRASAAVTQAFNPDIHRAGTTAVPADPDLQGFPRRVAFLRSGNNLAQASGSPIASVPLKDTAGARIPLTPATIPVPLGIDPTGNIQQFPYGAGTPRLSSDIAPLGGQALWFFTTNDNNDPANPGSIRFGNANPLYIYQMPSNNAGNLDPEGQPLLVPVLQIHSPEGNPGAIANQAFSGRIEGQWLQVAAPANQPGAGGNTFFNAAFVSGDTPSRPNESGGGLHNFVRFLEKWRSFRGDNFQARTASIRGSFIQTRKSAYATAPIKATEGSDTVDTALFYDNPSPIYNVLDGEDGGFRYSGGAFASKSPFYQPPTREWGFDVALLTQLPDLFAQQFTSDDDTLPQEFFREVGRDDPWIETLLCAGAADDRFGIATGVAFSERAVPNPPQNCPAIPAN
ncbi:MAG: hypothetical protein F6K16_20015 [Symploca sp. SIO2B6]|nr:hypothetical protein [Symploca sp. SIO2B6]